MRRAMVQLIYHICMLVDHPHREIFHAEYWEFRPQCDKDRYTIISYIHNFVWWCLNAHISIARAWFNRGLLPKCEVVNNNNICKTATLVRSIRDLSFQVRLKHSLRLPSLEYWRQEADLIKLYKSMNNKDHRERDVFFFFLQLRHMRQLEVISSDLLKTKS